MTKGPDIQVLQCRLDTSYVAWWDVRSVGFDNDPQRMGGLGGAAVAKGASWWMAIHGVPALLSALLSPDDFSVALAKDFQPLREPRRPMVGRPISSGGC